MVSRSPTFESFMNERNERLMLPEHIRYQTLFSPDRIELLDSVHFTSKSVNLNITNLGSVETVMSHEVTESAISYHGENTYPLLAPLLESNEATVSIVSSKVNPSLPVCQSSLFIQDTLLRFLRAKMVFLSASHMLESRVMSPRSLFWILVLVTPSSSSTTARIARLVQ
jgi:hypothetical protein